MADERVIRLEGLASGLGPTPLDGQFVVEFDPSRPPGPGCHPGLTCHLLTTTDPAMAARFTPREAIELWRAVDHRQPRRADGQPNRPLTAFTVYIEPPA